MHAQKSAAPPSVRRSTSSPSSANSTLKRTAALPSPSASPSAASSSSPFHSTPQVSTPLPPVHSAFHSNADGYEKKENDTGPARVRAKLESLSTRFDGFEDELNLSRHKKKADEDKRIQLLQTQLTNLQASLALESKNRSLSIKALQNWLTDRISQWTEQIEAPMQARLTALSEQLEYLVGRIDGLEARQKEDREVFPKLVDGRCEELLREMAELKNRFADQIQLRDEREKRILLKVQAESNKSAVQLQQEKIITDEKIKQLRQEIEEEVATRSKSHELVRSTLLEEVSQLKAELQREKTERETADEELVQSVAHYAAALQDGIKIVSTQ